MQVFKLLSFYLIVQRKNRHEVYPFQCLVVVYIYSEYRRTKITVQNQDGTDGKHISNELLKLTKSQFYRVLVSLPACFDVSFLALITNYICVSYILPSVSSYILNGIVTFMDDSAIKR